MVKPDIKHNYYSDLELPTTATVDDIRKAYRKLALQYHPDRNAGKEDECVPRFQAIQAANEVLSDPGTKSKYDQDRRKAGLYPTFKPNQPTPGNPYAATSNYPPPPRRTQPGTWQRPTPSYAPSGSTPTGADRFTNFPRQAGAMPRKDPAAERAQQFRAWQNMNNANEKSRNQYTAPPPPQPPKSPNPQTQNTARPRMPRQDTKMPTEEQIRAGMRYGKAGGPGDSPAAEKQSAWQAFQQANANKPGMGRNRRAPNTPRRPGGFDPNAPGSDERPAPQSTGHYSHRNRTDDLSPGGFPPPPPGPPPGSAPHSPTADKFQRPFAGDRGREVPYAEGNRKSTPYSSFIGEKLQFSSDGLRRSASTRDTSRLQPESNSTSTNRARSSSPAGRQPQPTSTDTRGKGSNKPFIPGASSESSTGTEGSSEYDPDVTETPEDMDSGASNSERPRNSTFAVPPDQRPKKTPKRPSSKLPNGSNFSSNATSPAFEAPGAQSDGDGPTMQQRQSSQNIFTFPIGNDTFTSTASKSRSFDNINTKFSPDGWNGSFTSSAAPDYFAAAGRRPSPGRRAPSSRGHGRAATADVPPRSNSNTPGDMGPPPPPRPEQPASMFTSPSDAKFNEEQWKDKFEDTSWAMPVPGGSNGGTNSKAPSRKSSKLHSKTSAEGVAGSRDKPHIIVDDDDTVEVQGSNGKPEAGVSVDDVDAMDIDTPPPAHPTEQTTSKEPRMYSVPKSTWREAAEKQTSGGARTASSMHRKQKTEPGLKTNFDDFSHVEPFAPSTDGLQNLADLSSTLPFQSQPHQSRTTPSSEPRILQTPKVPKAPEPPQTLSKAGWHSYALEFSTYLKRYHDFNKTMLTHFDAREKQAQARLMGGGSAWLEAIGGDTAHSQGFASYWKGVQEDEQVRETWNIACEKHLKAVEVFDQKREQVRKLSINGMLKDT